MKLSFLLKIAFGNLNDLGKSIIKKQSFCRFAERLFLFMAVNLSLDKTFLSTK